MNLTERHQQTSYKGLLERYLNTGYRISAVSLIRRDFINRFNCDAVEIRPLERETILLILIKAKGRGFSYRAEIKKSKFIVEFTGVRYYAMA